MSYHCQTDSKKLPSIVRPTVGLTLYLADSYHSP